MNLQQEIETYTQEFGEEYRRLITESLGWLEEQEPKWELAHRIGRRSFLRGLIARTVKEKR